MTAESQITTMDTTSHYFTWDTVSFWDGASSYFNDVAIINENEIWAVGKISSGRGIDPYNAIHWDGNEWILHKIYAITSYGDTSRGRINCIYAFSSDDLWTFSQAGSYSHWNGSEWNSEFIWERVGGINRIWDSSSNNLYFVGTNGNITHYDGNNWQIIDSRTDTDISDIWGVEDKKSGECFILCTVSNPLEPGERKILQIKNKTEVDTLEWNNDRRVFSTWFKNDNYIFTTGSGVFFKNKNQPWQEVQTIPWVTTESIRGNDINDIFVVGHFGLVAHFNGMNWKHYFDLNFTLYSACAYKENLMVAVGIRNPDAAILIMKR